MRLRWTSPDPLAPHGPQPAKRWGSPSLRRLRAAGPFPRRWSGSGGGARGGADRRSGIALPEECRRTETICLSKHPSVACSIWQRRACVNMPPIVSRPRCFSCSVHIRCTLERLKI
jgi:hypothetical protein